MFDTVKILVAIRRQDEMLKSMYAQVYNLVFKKFSMTSTFRTFLSYSLFENEKGGIIDSLFYNDVVMEYEKLFGEKNICVLVFEDLKEDSGKYIKKVCAFMGIDSASAIELIKNKHANKRSSASGYKSDERNLVELLSYYKNIFFGSRSYGFSKSRIFKMLEKIYVPGKTLKDLKIDMDAEVKLRGLYAESNRALSERYNLNLKKYGYYY
ncbi:MAG: sulfotransferase domain-containing protein [Deltaproteobacteria bacterium]|nr:sulfotransferase domain-containing protein [Deltaproteobacteria bacterium]